MPKALPGAMPGCARCVLISTTLLLVAQAPAAWAEKAEVNTLNDLFDRLSTCWKPPPASVANPMDITVSVGFNRAGQILGRPRIAFESAEATDNDRVAYRVAVMEALQRCTPMPFTETMGGAVAGRPFKVEFRTLKPPLPREKRAWLTQKIL